LPDVQPPNDLLDACLTKYGQMMRALLHVRAASMMSWNEAHLTLPQIRALSLLAGHAEGLSGRALASRLGVGPSAVTPLVDRLEDHGYVRREEDRADRRITRLLLTPEGATVLHQMAAGRREILAEVLQQLTPAELVVVDRAFALVAEGVQRANPTAEVALAACGPRDPNTVPHLAAVGRSTPPVDEIPHDGPKPAVANVTSSAEPTASAAAPSHREPPLAASSTA
jgi:DNA-binding MarR family transcriptional regulator